MHVFLTIDTEVYPRRPDWKQRHLREDLERDIYGITGDGEFGLRYQLRVMEQYGIIATFFVESLFASVPEVGAEPLRKIVELTRGGGHEVQLHLHPEWLPHIPELAAMERGEQIRCYSREQQGTLLRHARRNLEQCGAQNVGAFRAGDYAANADTLLALHDAGLWCDSSYNLPYVGSSCDLRLAPSPLQPVKLGDIWEYPVSWFNAIGGARHMQLCACSFGELRGALEAAKDAGWKCVVLVSHSFEMLRNRRSSRPRRRPEVTARFESLCRFLRERRDEFPTAGLTTIDPANLAGPASRAIEAAAIHTLARYSQQLRNRIASVFV